MKYDDASFKIYKEHVDQFDKLFPKGGKKPEPTDWRPMVFKLDGETVALFVIRYQPNERITEIDSFITNDPPTFEGYSGTKMAALFILCDAYRYGSTMEIRFTKNVEDGWVPLTLIAMADALEIELENIGEGIITPKESRMLFIALTGFSVEATNKINEITINGLVSPEHICCLIHSNSYSLEKIEEILLTEENPGLILKDLKCQPSDYLKFNI